MKEVSFALEELVLLGVTRDEAPALIQHWRQDLATTRDYKWIHECRIQIQALKCFMEAA